ncbi:MULTISPECIES: hypothetical protein [unclassified Marinitoga]|uniref:hypothetical protein n=1 Tax=unclassified Marinitoga TaxID=2640159 RepID=UPI000640D245|nr:MULTISPECIES: hypothetical protein [unclassified Marinitoga]KLO25142.1 hypothetical protein X274_00140 [Marinitoga sp. 1155]NUV00476.1 hypothetical protein [Marinitoga sp. 1154]
MKKLYIIFILLLAVFLYSEDFYLKNGEIIKGTLIKYNNNIFTVQTDKKTIEISKKDIVKISISKEIFNYEYNMVKSYTDWKIGGRRENGNLVYIDNVDNKDWLRIHKDGYTENTLYKDFELPYSNNTNIEFSAEIMGFTAKSLKLSEKKYALSGIIFIFLDKNKENLSKIAYAWGTNEYPFKKHEWINRLYASIYKPFEKKFRINDLIKDKEAKYLRIVFWTYCSSNEKELSSDLWVKNVKISFSYINK